MTRRDRAHEAALRAAQPTIRLVLAAIARFHFTTVDRLHTDLVTGVGSAVLTGMRPLLEELATALARSELPQPIADELEPEPDESPRGWPDEESTPVRHVDFSEAETAPGWPHGQRPSRAPTRPVSDPGALGRPGRTIPSMPPPPPPAERRGPPPLPKKR